MFTGVRHSTYRDARGVAHAYFFSWEHGPTRSLEVDWLDARNICRRHCMDAVSLETPQENEFIKQRIARGNKCQGGTNQGGDRGPHVALLSSFGSALNFRKQTDNAGQGLICKWKSLIGQDRKVSHQILGHVAPHFTSPTFCCLFTKSFTFNLRQ